MAITDGTQFGRVGAFKFWCQKVLPAVYDDSLSYYELLCKVMHWLQQLTDVTNTQSDAIRELQEKLQEFMDGMFDPYIEEKVDEWFAENEPNIMSRLAAIEADGWVTTDRIADSSVTMDKLSEDVVEVLDNLNYPEHLYGAKPVLRDEYDETQYIPQGFCVYPYDNPQYIAQYYQDVNSTSGILRIFQKTTKTLLSSTTIALGHGSNIDYVASEEMLYVLGENENHYVYAIDVSDPTSPSLSTAYDFTSIGMTPVCYFKNGKYCCVNSWVSKTRKLYVVNLSDMVYSELCTVPAKDENFPGLGQSYKYDETTDIFTFASSNEGSKITFFKSDGTLVQVMEMEPQYAFILMPELEGAQTIGTKFYFNTCMGGFESIIEYRHVCTLFEADLRYPSINCNKMNPTTNMWVYVLIDDSNNAYNDYADVNNHIGTGAHPIEIKYAGDLQSIPFACPGCYIHIAQTADYTADGMPINGGGSFVTVDGNSHINAGFALVNGNFAMRTQGYNNSTYSQFKTVEEDSKPVFIHCNGSNVLLQNIFDNSDIYAVVASNSLVAVRDSTTSALVKAYVNSIVLEGLHV